MRVGCLILAGLIIVAIMTICVMVKFATDISVEDKLRVDDSGPGVFKFSRSMGVISINEKSSLAMSQRFPYVAAVTRNSTGTWSFACFGSVILVKWVVTSAHCRQPGSVHRVLLYHDFVRNYSHTYPVLFWRLHESFKASSSDPSYDIAVAKMNLVDAKSFAIRSSVFDEKRPAAALESSVWKTVSTMDKRLFLTNDFESFGIAKAHNSKCYETYGLILDDTMFCADLLSPYEDCFVHEFGPIYSGDKVVGVLAIKPRDCDVKVAIFTNISYYANWILKSTGTTRFG